VRASEAARGHVRRRLAGPAAAHRDPVAVHRKLPPIATLAPPRREALERFPRDYRSAGHGALSQARLGGQAIHSDLLRAHLGHEFCSRR
jgi:hypothetical protein